MDELQNLRYELIRATYDVAKAREFYDFIIGNDEKPRMMPPVNSGYEVVGFVCYEDGIYLCYEDGYKKPFPTPFGTDVETTDHGQVTHLGIKVGKHMVGLKLNSFGEKELPYISDLGSEDFDYKEQELHALDDYDGKANTDHIKRLCEFEFDLSDDEWIPALGELAIIYKNKDKLNEALAFVGGDLLVDKWYWSSTESSAVTAWLVGFSDSTVAHGYKGGSFVVRPCCAF